MSEGLKRTPLAEEHEQLGAKMVDFGGWYMPVQYSGLIAEHTAVRERVGLFDVSHMGEIAVKGKDAIPFVNYLTTNSVQRLKDGQIHYTLLAYPEGSIVDDLLVYRHNAEHLLLVVNAGNQDKDWEWIQQHVGDFDVQLENQGAATAQLALQGPQAQAVLQPLVPFDLDDIPYYWFRVTEIRHDEVLVSRTGYTGEDGFELYMAAEAAPRIWKLLLEAGQPHGILPAGLGARDTLRLECRMALYGNDIDHTTTVLEAGLGWVLKLKKRCDFIGKATLKQLKKTGPTRKLVGFEMISRGIARHGHPIIHEGQEVGYVTSGTHSPTLRKAVGMGYVPIELAEPGTEITIQIRKRPLTARIVDGPFYKRK